MKPLITPIALLASVDASAASTLPSAAGSIFQMLFGLALVLVVMLVVLRMLKKLQGTRAAGGALKVLGATAVGPRERVVLVAVGDTVLVLGVAPGRVNALHSLPASELPVAPEAATAPAAEFAGRLRQFMESRRGQQ